MERLSLIYLARMASGIASFRSFVESYRRHPTGIDHQLVVAYKGFPSPPEEYRALLADVPHTELDLPDTGYDIGSYVAAARRAESTYCGFLNSSSEILAPGWLRALSDHVSDPGVGAVGATGSWESLYTTYATSSRARVDRTHWRIDAWRRTMVRRWRLWRYRADFLPAPNPHLRTNAFLIERQRWLSLRTGPLRTKRDLWRFESGRHSMTRQLQAQGLGVLVAGRDGVAHEPDRWPQSLTFRSGTQHNLLVADNRTRQYDAAGDAEKTYLRTLAWGSRDAHHSSVWRSPDSSS